MAGEDDGFLQRWSRRKQAAARAPAPGKPDPAPAAQAARSAAAAEAGRVAEEETARAALLARLPKLDELTTASDFSAFMHPLVPAALRSAALARMWTLDPAIRDFVGPARDYAWDWNVPGGVPGGGPAPALSEIEATLRRLTARLDRDEAPSEPRPPGEEIAAPRPAPPPIAAAEPQPELPTEPLATPETPPVAASPTREEPPSSDPPPRRHGGAMPA